MNHEEMIALAGRSKIILEGIVDHNGEGVAVVKAITNPTWDRDLPATPGQVVKLKLETAL